MEVTPLMPGSFYVTDGEHTLLAGAPPEIIKVIRQRGLSSPQYLLLPDIPIALGESQVAVEFPLYHHLFFSRPRTTEPMILLGNARRVAAARDLLDLTLFGPDEPRMRAWGLSQAEAEALAREMRWFQMKDEDGKPLTIDALVTGREIGNGELDLGWVKIRRRRINLFRLSSGRWTAEIDLDVRQEQGPPYPVSTDLTVSSLVKLGIEVLGGATGFSATQASSGLAMCYNGNYILIDAIPYVNYHLRARGIARNQVHSLFLTHIHDDHCNVVPLLQYNRKMHVLTVPLVYRMMLEKLALTLDRPVERLREYFTFVPLTPGQQTDFFGLKITPHWSIHSIPTLGAEFATEDAGVTYTLGYTGDTQSLEDMRQMRKTGVIDAERYNAIAEIYQKPFHMLIADGGEGVLHGDPGDASSSEAERIVFLHLDTLPERFHAQFTVASSGKRFPILHGDTDYNLTRTIEFLMEYFPQMPPMWISNLLANQKVLTFNAGDIILRQGSRSEGYVYMILTGYAQVIHYDGKKKNYLAVMEAGELIGEMSIITGRGERNASVVALSPVTVTALSETAFHSYIRHQKYEEKLRTMWRHRELLQTLPYLRPLQQPVIRALSERTSLGYLAARTAPEPVENICGRGGLLFPLGQDLEIAEERKTLEVPANSQPVLCDPGAKLVTRAEFQYLLLDAEAAAALRCTIPAFRFFWEETLGLPVPADG
jgi:Cyclic nucleotide-binding domain/Beta-lactamase superfamily domain